MTPTLGSLEELILLAAERLDDASDALSIQALFNQRLGRTLSSASIYTTLERLSHKGYVQPEAVAPRPVRGGRRKTRYRLTEVGREAVALAAWRRRQVGREA